MAERYPARPESLIRDREARLLVVETGDQPVGFPSGYLEIGGDPLIVEADRSAEYLSTLFFIEKAHGRGIARRLIEGA